MPGFSRSVGEITPWDDGFDTRLIRNDGVAPSQHWALTLLPARPARPLPDEVQTFIAAIPAELRDHVKRFAFGQALMLKTLARSGEARELAVAHPVIFWLMIAAVYDSRIPPGQLERLSRSKRIEILQRLINSRSRSRLKFLGKIDIDTGTLGDAHDVTRALADPVVVAAAAHERQVSIRLLRALSAYPILARPMLVRILAGDATIQADATLCRAEELAGQVVDIRRMAAALGIEHPDQALARCRSSVDIRRLHDRWVERLNRRRAARDDPAALMERLAGTRSPLRPRRRTGSVDPDTDEAWAFPPPPLPDSLDIVAIRSYDELRREGIAQGNCVASYAHTVASGRKYIYRVLAPQRATLELKRCRKGWTIGQLKLAKNGAPAASTVFAVAHWLERASAGVPRPGDESG